MIIWTSLISCNGIMIDGASIDLICCLVSEISHLIAFIKAISVKKSSCCESYAWIHIAQVYRLSAVHCQVTRYSPRVPGYLTRYSVSANQISFDKRISQSDCVFQLMFGLEEHYSPSPLSDFNRLFEGQMKILFKIWHLNTPYFYMTLIWSLKCKFVSLLCW